MIEQPRLEDEMGKMLFFFKPMVLCCVLAVHIDGGQVGDKLTLEAIPGRFDTLSTRGFSLKCDFKGDKNHQIVSLVLDKVRTGKMVADRGIASITNDSPVHINHPLPYMDYSGEIAKGKAYLYVNWTVLPMENLSGKYRCRINLMGPFGQINSDRSVDVIKETNPDFNSVVTAVRELQTSQRRLWDVLKSWQKLVGKSFFFLNHGLMTVKKSENLNGHFYVAYIFKPAAFEHQVAGALCQVEGGYLAEIKDVKERHFLAKFLQGQSQPGFYIAGRRNKRDNKFYWSRTGQLVPKTLEYARGQPDNYGHEEACLELQQVSKWKVNDITCWTRHAFICQFPTA